MKTSITKFFGQIDLTKGKIVPNLVFFTLPFFITYFLNSLYGAVDLFFISQYSNSISVAAVSSGTTIMFAVNSIILGLATGGTVIIGQYFGAKLKEGIEVTTRNLIIYMAIVALAITAIMLCLSFPIIDWLHIDEAASQTAKLYLIIYASGIPLYVGYVTISAILRGLGNSFAPFVFVVIATIVNISLDALFIIVLKWGAVGAAVATIIGEGVSFLAGLIFLLFIRKFPYKLSLKKGLQKKTVLRIIKCGLPVAIQDGLVVLSFAVILAAISSRGLNYTAAVGITDRVTSFCFVPLSAIGTAISTATAQNMGAYQIDRVKKYLRWGMLFSCIIGAILLTLCLTLPKQLASIFAGGDEETINIASTYITSTVLDVAICAIVFPLNSVFIGSGHTVFAMSQNLGTTFLVRVPIALIFALVMNADMYLIGLSYPIATTVSLIACLIFYFSKRWMNLKKLAVTEDLYNEFVQKEKN